MRRETLDKNYDKVYALLRDHPEARENYAYLFLLFWEKFDYNDQSLLNKSYIELAKFHKLVSPETIGRLRRKIQQQGYFQTEKQKERAAEHEAEVKAWSLGKD